VLELIIGHINAPTAAYIRPSLQRSLLQGLEFGGFQALLFVDASQPFSRNLAGVSGGDPVRHTAAGAHAQAAVTAL